MDRRAFLGLGASVLAAGCSMKMPDTGGGTIGSSDSGVECFNGTPVSSGRDVDGGESWPSLYQNARNTGFSPDLKGPSGCVEQQWVWSYDDPIGTNGGMHSSVVIHDSTIYIGDESRYYADDTGDTPDNNTVITVNAATGEEQWRFDGIRSADGTPVYHDGTLYIPGNGRLQAVDVEAQELLWTKDYLFDGSDADQETFEHPVVSDDGYLYAGSFTGDVYAIQAATGEIEWHFRTEGLTDDEILDDVSSLIEETMKNGDVAAPLSLAGDTVYVPTWGNRVYALDRHTGEKRWAFSTNTLTHGDRPRAPVIDDGEMYIGTENGLFYAVDVSDGSLAWEYTEKKYGQGISPAVDDEHVYLSAGESYPKTKIHALDRETHEVVWETEVAPPNRGPVVDSESLYIGSARQLVAMEKATGELEWMLDMTAGSYSVPAIVDGAVFMADTNGNVFAVW